MKCEICGRAVSTTFLKKILGAYVKDEKGKKHVLCFECQKKFLTKEEMLKNLR
jgi:hypothetical protein